MRPFWHPLSALLLPGLDTYASPGLIRMLLATSGRLELTYTGDRMLPAVPHGRLVVVEKLAGPAETGDVVLAAVDGIPEMLRVVGRQADRLLAQADADPSAPVRLPADAVLGRVRLERARISGARRRRRRLALDLVEALTQGLAPGERDPGATVRTKYDVQAPFYASSRGEELESGLARRLALRVPRGGRILVAGSGAGRECFALAEAGWQVAGVDFSPEMVRAARQAAAERGLDVKFTEADLSEHFETPGSVQAILFTYDLYSFLPWEDLRVAILRRMARWISPTGVVFLSARRVETRYERWILSLQWLRRRALPGTWGWSHTRYVDPRGALQRSFVHYFTLARLRREVGQAGFRLGRWQDGHTELSRPATRSGRETETG